MIISLKNEELLKNICVKFQCTATFKKYINKTQTDNGGSQILVFPTLLHIGVPYDTLSPFGWQLSPKTPYTHHSVN